MNTNHPREKSVNELSSIDAFVNRFLKRFQGLYLYLEKEKKQISESSLIINKKLYNDESQFSLQLFTTNLLINSIDNVIEIINNFKFIALNMKKKIIEQNNECTKYNKLVLEAKKKYKTLSKSKNDFYSIAEKAEKETMDSIKLTTINNKEDNGNWKKLLNETKKKYDEYKIKLNDTNQTIIDINKSKNILINSFNETNKEFNDLIINSLNKIIEKQKNKNLINETNKNFLNTSKNIKNENSDKNLDKNLFEIIPFEQYHSKLNYDECDDDLIYSIYGVTIGTMENYIGEYVSQEEKNIEDYKNQAKGKLKQLLLLKNDSFNKENQEQILNYLNDSNIHPIFLKLLTNLRVLSEFEKSELFIKTMGESLNKILEEVKKKNDYETALNCITLSQTFYYKDENSNKKIYIIKLLQKNKWITSLQFWIELVDKLYNKDKERIIKSNVVKWNDLDNDKKNLKKGQILFSQIVPCVQNMFELCNDKKFVFKVIDNISQKYNYLTEEQKNTLYNLIGIDKSDIDKIKNEAKNNLNCEIVKENEFKEDDEKEINNNKTNENKEINNNIEINENKEIINNIDNIHENLLTNDNEINETDETNENFINNDDIYGYNDNENLIDSILQDDKNQN